VLATSLQDVLASTNSASSSQTDPNQGGHPAAVSPWDDLNQLVLGHVASLSDTPAMFPGISMPASKVRSNEMWSICQLFLWEGLTAFFCTAGQC
jgi:hypothetical protein